jgi:hypothetical protein
MTTVCRVLSTQRSVVAASRRQLSLFLSSDTGVLYLISLPAVTTPHHTTSAPYGTLNYNKLTLLAGQGAEKHTVLDTP